jgi:hypothetical protein
MWCVFYLNERILLFDIHMSVHYNIIPNYSQQNTTFLDLLFLDALNVSGGFSVYHQEHTTVETASGIVNCDDRVK